MLAVPRSARKSKPGKAAPVLAVRSVPIADITVPRGQRPLRDVEALARSIDEVGLLCPILVDAAYTLIAGRHRLEACKVLGHDRIDARVVDLDELRAELAGLDENLERFELTELEKARALKRRKDLYEVLHPDARPVRVRGGPGRGKKTSAKLALVLPFTKDTARKLGASPRSVQRSVQIAEALDPKTMKLIEQTWVADSQTDLLRLARFDVPTRHRVAELIASGEVTYIKAALREAQWENLVAEAPVARNKAGRFQVYRGDFARVATKHVEPGSVDLVLTDPQWDEAAADRYVELAEVANRALKPGGLFLATIGQDHMLPLLDAMKSRLDYLWTICLLHETRGKQKWPAGMMSFWTPVLLFAKGTSKPSEFFGDVVKDREGRSIAHHWEKGEGALRELVNRYCRAGGLVFDPYCGSGTTGVAALRLGRRFLGADLDPKAVKLARARLAQTKWADPEARIEREKKLEEEVRQ